MDILQQRDILKILHQKLVGKQIVSKSKFCGQMFSSTFQYVEGRQSERKIVPLLIFLQLKKK